MRSSSSTSRCRDAPEGVHAAGDRRGQPRLRSARGGRGHGGHFLGAEHTMERFRDCFYRPFLNSSDNFERWTRLGARDTATRAGEIVDKTLEEYEAPPLDDAIREELEDYVIRRRAELGD
ncbi:MAG: trimethylamine methyltransferase family protein [Candidatus Nanopelagicales bacterium]